MSSVFRLNPHDLRKKMVYFNDINENLKNNYTFLDNIREKYEIDVSIYYLIIDSIEEFKLKNIFYFINLRLKNIGEKIHYNIVDRSNINDIFNNYINDSDVKSIMIMNFIQQYIYPQYN